MKNKYQGIQEVCNDWHYNKKLKKWFHEDSDDYKIQNSIIKIIIYKKYNSKPYFSV